MHSIVFLSFFSQSLMRLNLLVRIRNIKECTQSFVCVCVCAIRVYCVKPLMNDSIVDSMPNCLCARISYKFFLRGISIVSHHGRTKQTHTHFTDRNIFALAKLLFVFSFGWQIDYQFENVFVRVCPCVCALYLVFFWRLDEAKKAKAHCRMKNHLEFHR